MICIAIIFVSALIGAIGPSIFFPLVLVHLSMNTSWYSCDWDLLFYFVSVLYQMAN